MPILEIEIVEAAEAACAAQAQDLADAAAAVFDAEPGRVWVKLRRLAAADYAENGAQSLSGAPPVFVRTLLHKLPAVEERARLARALAEAIGSVCQREAGRVHILFEPDAEGRVAFGGVLR